MSVLRAEFKAYLKVTKVVEHDRITYKLGLEVDAHELEAQTVILEYIARAGQAHVTMESAQTVLPLDGMAVTGNQTGDQHERQ